MSEPMTPERRKQIKRFTSDPMGMSDFNLTPALLNECLEEIKRLQAPLPDDLEKRLREIEWDRSQSGLYGSISCQIIYKRDVPWLTTTIRALQAKNTWFEQERAIRERESQDDAITRGDMHRTINKLQAELQNERGRVKQLEKRITLTPGKAIDYCD